MTSIFINGLREIKSYIYEHIPKDKITMLTKLILGSQI